MAGKGRSRSVWVSLVAGASVALLILVLGAFHVFDQFENSVWDLRVRTLATPSKATGQIDLILLDQTSLDWADQNQGQSWPWPREYFALVANFLARAQVKAAVFDVIFDQPSTLAGDDEIFAKSLKSLGRVVFAESVTEDAKGFSPQPPTEILARAVASVGHVRSSPDPDGTNRRITPVLTLADGSKLPSLAMAAWKLGTGRSDVKAGTDEAILRYRGPQGVHRIYTAAQIIRSAIQLRDGEKPDFDPALFRDHYVFFGYSAQGLLDLRPTPVDNKSPGVEVHATHLDNLLAADGIVAANSWWSMALVLFWSLASAMAVSRIRRATAIAPVFLLAAGLPTAAGWLAYSLGWWLPVVPPVLAALVAGLSMLLVNYAVEGRQKRFIQNAFGQYLSPQVIERLVADPDQLKLGGEKRCLSIYFSDIAGFTSISEKLDPVGLTSLLNDYLSEMTSIIYAYGGTIDKYEGDAVIAFWNAPLDLPDHAAQAVRACLACQKKLAEIQPRLQKLSGRPVTARIGLNSGDVVIGNMGSSQRFNYTFLGDAGNLASRLEGINKLFGTPILASEFTKEIAGETPDLHWREISRVRVVGKNRPVTVYEPMAREDAEAQKSALEAFDRALRLYYQGDFPSALEGFQAWADRDPPSAKYADRVRELIADPPAAWEGVWDAKEK